MTRHEKLPQRTPPLVHGLSALPAQPAFKGMSVSSMALGLASFFLGWTIVVPLVGLTLGFFALRFNPSAKGMAVTGLILNGLMLLGWVLLVLIVIQPWDFSVPPQK